MLNFEWDEGNMKHVIDDYPERENTLEEIEFIFNDPDFFIKKGNEIDEEERFTGVGYGFNQILKVVVFVIRGENIRPISCWKAKKKTQNYYHENVRKEKNGD